jgi:hypothetical protein
LEKYSESFLSFLKELLNKDKYQRASSSSLLSHPFIQDYPNHENPFVYLVEEFFPSSLELYKQSLLIFFNSIFLFFYFYCKNREEFKKEKEVKIKKFKLTKKKNDEILISANLSNLNLHYPPNFLDTRHNLSFTLSKGLTLNSPLKESPSISPRKEQQEKGENREDHFEVQQLSEEEIQKNEKLHLKEIKKNLKLFLQKLRDWKKENKTFLMDLPNLSSNFLHSSNFNPSQKRSLTHSFLSFSQLLSHPLFGILPSHLPSQSLSSTPSTPHISLPSFSGRECVDWIFEL